jgi:glucose/arabinose dehydrogenase
MAGDAFVSFHGSWNRDPPTGYRVIRVVFDGGEPVSYESFLSYVGPGATGPGWPHRPVGVRVGHGGELLVTSDASGVVLAVGYEPP